MKPIHNDREQWLTAAAEMLLHEHVIPAADRIGARTEPDDSGRYPFRVTCGWPYGTRSKATKGAAYARAASTDGTAEVFVVPTIDDPRAALGILWHEMIHVVLDGQDGHRGRFLAIANAMDFEGRPTAALPGPQCEPTIAEYLELLGPYPHGRMDIARRKKASNRQLKLDCLDCKAIWRMSAKWAPSARICPCCESSRIRRQKLD